MSKERLDKQQKHVRSVLKSVWTVSIIKLLVFIAILYDRGIYELKSIKAFYFFLIINFFLNKT